MKKILTYFFTTLGVIFFILLCALAYLWFADPFNIRPLIEMMTADTPPAVQVETTPGTATTSSVPTTSQVDKNPALSPAQESALESVGINPENLPSSITPEMESCFTSILGAARVAEIKAGASPTAVEVFSTRSCYQ